MKPVLWGGAVVAAAAACVYALAAAPAPSRASQGQAEPTLWPSTPASNMLVLMAPRGGEPMLLPLLRGSGGLTIPGLFVTNKLLSPRILLGPYQPGQPGQFNLLVMTPGRGVPAPGVYQTLPYRSLVVVPGPMADDRCIINPGGGHSPMPMVKPELRFLPWTPTR